MEQWRGTQRYAPIQRNDEEALTRAIVTLATKYGQYGYGRSRREDASHLTLIDEYTRESLAL